MHNFTTFIKILPHEYELLLSHPHPMRLNRHMYDGDNIHEPALSCSFIWHYMWHSLRRM